MIDTATPQAQCLPVFCPICGSDSTAQYHHPGNNFVKCNNCGLTGPSKRSRDDAVRIWNTRYMCQTIEQLLKSVQG